MNNADSIEVTAATVEEAIRDALEKLGAAEDDVVIEVLATPRSGVLGLGARQAKVRVNRRPELEARSAVAAPPPAPPLRRETPPPRAQSAPPQVRRETAPVPTPPRTEQPVTPPRAREERPREERAREERREPRRGRPQRPEQRGQGQPRPEPRRERRPEPQPEPAREEFAAPEREQPEARAEAGMEEGAAAPRIPANLDEQVRDASTVLKQLLELMNEKAEVERVEGEPESIEFEIKGDGSGILIGRHGQTLDALEYILNRIVARRFEDAMPILIDTESYRARRRQQLHRMALSMSERAKREHAPVKLDPMPPRDRRIIHLALKDDPMVSTRSEGEGFLRAVEIIPAEGRRERGSSGGGGGGPRERGREHGRERDRERDKGNSPRPGVGEQGGFKHGQKRLF